MKEFWITAVFFIIACVCFLLASIIPPAEVPQNEKEYFQYYELSQKQHMSVLNYMDWMQLKKLEHKL